MGIENKAETLSLNDIRELCTRRSSLPEFVYCSRFKLAELELGCYTSASKLNTSIGKFFSELEVLECECGIEDNDMSIMFFVYNDMAGFIEELVADPVIGWEKIGVEKNGRWDPIIDIYVSARFPELSLFSCNGLLGIADTKNSRGYYIVPESVMEKEATFEHFVEKLFLDFLFATLIWDKGKMQIHASCVADRKGRGILIAGQSGKGKTSLALALLNRGYGLVANDITFLEEKAGKISAYGFPEKIIKVRKNIIKLFPEYENCVIRWEESLGYLDTSLIQGRVFMPGCTLNTVCIPSDKPVEFCYSCEDSADFMKSLLSASCVSFPRTGGTVTEKLNFISKLYAKTSYLYYHLPREYDRFIRAVPDIADEIERALAI